MQSTLIKDVKEKELFPGYTSRFVHTKNMTFNFIDIEAGYPFPEHSHMHEQVTIVLEGKFELTIDGETKVLEGGSVVAIPPNATHVGKAITKCKLIDVFYPIREDYKV